MESCFCDIDCSDGEPIVDYKAARGPVRTREECMECGATIWPGALVEHVTGAWENAPISWYTCEICLRVRDDLMGTCYCHGSMREDIGCCLGIDYVTGEVDENWEPLE